MIHAKIKSSIFWLNISYSSHRSIFYCILQFHFANNHANSHMLIRVITFHPTPATSTAQEDHGGAIQSDCILFYLESGYTPPLCFLTVYEP
ncbi:hypothetical protein ATY35_01180 [Vibrio cidicii]|uniref:Uncharacterized protein n=1 Tax=Vibrio cidicii TaxID=1763883 RepID=A0ABR5W7Q2_9VIBR|nr:hypothetical protein ATY35_01180 [Vibrio cidicii]